MLVRGGVSTHVLLHHGKEYDAAAIAGIAHGLATGRTLAPQTSPAARPGPARPCAARASTSATTRRRASACRAPRPHHARLGRAPRAARRRSTRSTGTPRPTRVAARTGRTTCARAATSRCRPPASATPATERAVLSPSRGRRADGRTSVSMSEDEIEMPRGTTSSPERAGRLELRAGPPARLLDLGAVDVDVGGDRAPGEARASGWPAAARAGCRSSSPRPPARRPPRRTSRRTASSRVSPGSQKPASVDQRPAGQAGLRPSRIASSSPSPCVIGHDHRRVGAGELCAVALRAAQLVARQRG